MITRFPLRTVLKNVSLWSYSSMRGGILSIHKFPTLKEPSLKVIACFSDLSSSKSTGQTPLESEITKQEDETNSSKLKTQDQNDSIVSSDPSKASQETSIFFFKSEKKEQQDKRMDKAGQEVEVKKKSRPLGTSTHFYTFIMR